MNNVEVQRPVAGSLAAIDAGRTATLTRAADIISNVTAPPFLAVPTIIILGLYDGAAYRDVNESIIVALLFGVLLPTMIVLALVQLGRIDSVHIPRREQRILPFSLSLLGYVCGFLLLRTLDGPRILSAIMLAYAVNNAVVMAITLWWKVSVHATGVGGPMAALVYTFGLPVLPLFLLIPLVSWARVHLRAHTLGQVTVGACIGVGLTLLQFALIFKPLGLI